MLCLQRNSERHRLAFLSYSSHLARFPTYQMLQSIWASILVFLTLARAYCSWALGTFLCDVLALPKSYWEYNWWSFSHFAFWCRYLSSSEITSFVGFDGKRSPCYVWSQLRCHLWWCGCCCECLIRQSSGRSLLGSGRMTLECARVASFGKMVARNWIAWGFEQTFEWQMAKNFYRWASWNWRPDPFEQSPEINTPIDLLLTREQFPFPLTFVFHAFFISFPTGSFTEHFICWKWCWRYLAQNSWFGSGSVLVDHHLMLLFLNGYDWLIFEFVASIRLYLID